jgi:hypothetical protein
LLSRPPSEHILREIWSQISSRDEAMALPFFLAALFGKAAVGAVSKGLAAKGLAAKGSAVGTKAATGHRGHHALARKVVGKIVNKVTDEVVNSALSKADAVMSNRTKNKQDR